MRGIRIMVSFLALFLLAFSAIGFAQDNTTTQAQAQPQEEATQENIQTLAQAPATPVPASDLTLSQVTPQENITVQEPMRITSPAASAVTVPAAVEPETQWLWGEVVSVDAQMGEIKASYLDYETDNEKEILINVNDKTNFENVKSINDIKGSDTISVDYTLSPEGKNIAKNISVEKAEETAKPVSESSSQPAAQPATTP